jgi:hypothetical protein
MILSSFSQQNIIDRVMPPKCTSDNRIAWRAETEVSTRFECSIWRQKKEATKTTVASLCINLHARIIVNGRRCRPYFDQPGMETGVAFPIIFRHCRAIRFPIMIKKTFPSWEAAILWLVNKNRLQESS